MVVRYFTTKVLPAVAVGATAITLYCTTAQAFFPPIPVGSDSISTPPTVSPQVPLTPAPTIPPAPTPPFVAPVRPLEKPMPTYVCVTPQVPVRPSEVPEPTMIVAGVLALGAFGAAAIKKKLNRKTEA